MWHKWQSYTASFVMRKLAMNDIGMYLCKIQLQDIADCLIVVYQGFDIAHL